MSAPLSERPLSLDDLVKQAASLPEDERLAFLRNTCGSDQQLLAAALLRLEPSSAPWWDHSIEARALDTTPPARQRIGELLGPYRILRTLGQGGMGEVLLAERDDQQFRQQVAIKLVRSGAVSRNVQGRLKAERQILATLDHPSIARLLDGGTTADGTPYIVMEYIDGEPIDAYCDARRLDIETRLKLFRAVCSAVHCAHQNLIVHRDLKPSNILVTKEGIPKLLDFGIAKILDERSMMHTLAVTQLDMRVMTPEHASPEQIRGDPITTVSDIYALGVLLYELLTGSKPYRLSSARLSDIEDAICERQPIALGDALRDDEQGGERAAVARATTVSQLRRTLSGDLENIVMMALRKEPERRYSSAEQFAADIERYLRGLPVSATRDSWQYRARKFVSRHRLGVSASMLAFAGLLAFAIVTTLQAQRIERERSRAEYISAFLVDMFERADPSHSRGKDITIREILDIGSRRIGNELADQPVTQAQLRATIGNVYADLGLYAEAESLLREALAARERLFGQNHLETASALQDLGDVLLKQKRLPEAEAMLFRALEIKNRSFSGDDVEVASTLRSMSELRQEQQQLDAAEQLIRESLRALDASRATRAAPRLTEEKAAALNRLAVILEKKREFPQAERTYRDALTSAQQALGPDHPTTTFLTHNLAKAIEAQGRIAEARPLYEKSLELYRQIFGPQHPETLIAEANFGILLHRLRDLDAAEKIFRDVLALRSKTLGERHSRVGYDRVNLGLLLHDRGRFEEAVSEFRLALDIYRESLPPQHTFIGSARRSLAVSLLAQRKPDDAIAELKAALEVFQSGGLNAANPQIQTTQAALGNAFAQQRRFKEAESLLLQSYSALQGDLGSDHPAVRRAHAWVEDLYREWGKPEQAALYFASLDKR